ncbi:MAG: hypothetical protein BWY99_01670 [Synergistetes bacterium ADurb.BinA166]|nr:MAG: hypothetical protein BWY99_01670 [Synergistetes bacterium ADurb.BinA166]
MRESAAAKRVREAIQADKILNDRSHTRRPHVASALAAVKKPAERRLLAAEAIKELWGVDIGEEP